MMYETWVEVIIFLWFGHTAGGAMHDVMVLRILRLSRLTRLARIARVVRVLRAMPELSILSKAMLLAMRSVGATLLLFVVGIYVFAIFFVELLQGTAEGTEQFPSVLMGMHTLLVYGILADQTDLINAMLGT